MKFGAVFPANFGNDPILIRDFVQAIEDLGYDYILSYEQIVDSIYPEPLTLLSYIAAFAKKLEIATGITVLSSRQTVLVAKQVAQLDGLCGGRLRYGVSAGWNQKEFQLMNLNYHERGKRLDEQILVLRKLWTESSVNFQGAYHQLENVDIVPKPTQKPVPIWIGGYADAVLQRVGTLGDGWLADANQESPTGIRKKLDSIKYFAEKAKRNPADIGLEIVDVKLEEALSNPARLREWETVGAKYISVTSRHAKLESLQEHLEHYARFIKTAYNELTIVK